MAIIALLTDFGLDDPYTGSMKGAILSVAPSAQIVDISHLVPPQGVDDGAFILWSVFRSFPDGTIFVCVVDPGVGTSRRILCARSGGYHFLAPDNGVLKFVMHASRLAPIVSVTNKRLFRREVSRTFHGRDIFGPVAAHLALGTPMKELGAQCVPKYGPEGFLLLPKRKRFSVTGKILHIDHYGNIVTNVLLHSGLGAIRASIGGLQIDARSTTYGGAEPGIPFMIVGSTGLLEVSMRNASAASALGAVRGQSVIVSSMP